MRLVLVTPFLETRGGLDRVILKIAEHFDARIHCIRYDPQNSFSEFEALDIRVAKPGLLSKLPALSALQLQLKQENTSTISSLMTMT